MPSKNRLEGSEFNGFYGDLSQNSVRIVCESRQAKWLKRFDFVRLLLYNKAGRHLASPSSPEGAKLNQLSLHLHAPADSCNQAVVSPIRGCRGFSYLRMTFAVARRSRFSFH